MSSFRIADAKGCFGDIMKCKNHVGYLKEKYNYVLKCKNCLACEKGFFKSLPDKYVCIGVPEPFIIDDVDSYCNKYLNDNSFDCWSWNEIDNDTWSHGTFSTREDAIKDALGCMEFYKEFNPVIHLGKCIYVPLRTDVDAERVLQYLDEAYCSDTGCEDYIYEDVTDDQIEWLENKLSDVMVEFHERIGLKPTWFEVIEQEEINLNDVKNMG